MGRTEQFMSSLGEPEVGERMNAFFGKVIDRIGLNKEQRSRCCEVKSRILPTHDSSEPQDLRPSDDRVTELWVQERVVASMLEIRDNFNFAQILLADYLTDELIATLRRS